MRRSRTTLRSLADRSKGPDRPIRVLWLVKGLGPGGMERLLVLAAPRIDRNRIELTCAHVLSRKTALVAELEHSGVPVSCLGAGRFGRLRWPWRLRARLRGGSVDVVHAHSPMTAVGARLVRLTLPRGSRPRIVTTDHSVWHGHRRSMQGMNALTAGLDDARIAVSETVRHSLPPRLRRTTETIVHGVDVSAVGRQRAGRAEVRAELGIGPDELVVGTVANFRPVKAYPVLLDAARELMDDPASIRFVAVGQGPQEQQMRDLHDALGLGDRVLLLGYRADAVRVMAACDVFCLPSLHEGLPVALMEALALGLPVVASDVGGIGELVTHGSEGLLVPPGDTDALAAALRELLADADRRSTMAAAALARSGDLSIDGAVRRTEEIYLGLNGS